MGNNKYNKTMPTIRILVAFYLLWTVYGVVKGILSGDAEASPFMIIAVIVFVICSIFFLVTSTKELIRIEKEEKEAAEQEALENAKKEEQDTRILSIRERASLAKDVQVPEGVVDELNEEDEAGTPEESEAPEKLVGEELSGAETESEEEVGEPKEKAAEALDSEPVLEPAFESEPELEVEFETEPEIQVQVVSAEDVQVVEEGDDGELEVVAEAEVVEEEEEK